MIDDLQRDPMMRLIGGLEQARPDAARAADIRQRCHAALSARRPGTAEVPARHGRGAAFVGFLCAVYLAEIARQALTVFLAVRRT